MKTSGIDNLGCNMYFICPYILKWVDSKSEKDIVSYVCASCQYNYYLDDGKCN